MGDIIHMFEGFDKPRVYIKRRIDRIETQELHMNFMHGHNSWLSTETGNQLSLHCVDEDGNTLDVDIPISVGQLKEALEKYNK